MQYKQLRKLYLSNTNLSSYKVFKILYTKIVDIFIRYILIVICLTYVIR